MGLATPKCSFCEGDLRVYGVHMRAATRMRLHISGLETNLLSKCPMVRCIFNLPYLRRYLELEAHILWEKIWEREVNAFGTLFYSNSKFSIPLFRISDPARRLTQMQEIDRFESECSHYLRANIIFGLDNPSLRNRALRLQVSLVIIVQVDWKG